MSNSADSIRAFIVNNGEATGFNTVDADLQRDWNYEATVAEVEAILGRIESGELDLAEVFDQFAIAVEYLHQCESFLTQRQRQMDLLIETLQDDSEV